MSVPLAGAVPKTAVPILSPIWEWRIEPIESSAYSAHECEAETGTWQLERQALPSQEKSERHANVHCPGVSEKCQVPLTDWDSAFDSAFGTSVPGDGHPQTSGTHCAPDSPVSGTNPDSQDAVSLEREICPKAQRAFEEAVPWSMSFCTWDDCPLESQGMEYPEAVVASQNAGLPASAPSMRAPLEESDATSLMSPPDAPGSGEGKSPATVAVPDSLSAATWTKLRTRFPDPEGSTTSVAHTRRYEGFAVPTPAAVAEPPPRRSNPGIRFKSEILNFSGSSFRLA